MESMEKTLLVLSALGSDRPGLVNQLSEVVASYQGSIADSRMTVLGGEFAFLMLVSVPADKANALSEAAEKKALELGLTLLVKETRPRQAEEAARPYIVEVVALDNPGIVRDLADYFSRRNINIETMDTETYAAPHTGTTMFKLRMVVNLPASIKIAALREDFLHYCDERNLDATIEAAR